MTATMNMIRLSYHQLAVGTPLAFDVFDIEGKLLLRHGALVPSEGVLAKLIEHGVYGDAEAMRKAGVSIREKPCQHKSRSVCVMAEIDEIAKSLNTALSAPGKDAPQVFLELAGAVQDVCVIDPDAALASILLKQRAPYPVRQMLNVAILSESVAAQLFDDRNRRLPMVAAALTMNIALLELQEFLYSHQEPLSKEQKIATVKHPQAGVERLQELGVSDPNWLDIVLQHHEVLDGSGYPSRLQGGQIKPEAQIIAMADQYCSVVSERAYRAGLPPNEALKVLLGRSATRQDSELSRALVKLTGMYPPGTLVRLANGEKGIVTKHTLHAMQPIVSALISGNGIRFPEPRKRVTGSQQYAVAEVLGFKELERLELNFAALWRPAVVAEGVA
jgi:HD-GYP domain-containing protein (c-di-GMP phosphodiesterase class II)